MNLIYIVVIFLLTLSSCISSVRWGRVAQREHYIPGYVTKFYFRWVRLVPFNNLYFFFCLVLMFSSLWSPFPAIILAVVTLFTPVGLSFQYRTSKVSMTQRLKRLNLTYYLLLIIISTVSIYMDLGYFLTHLLRHQ